MKRINAKDLTVEQPLKHRPGVVKVTLPDGRSKIFNDGNPLSPSELVAIQGGLAESTTRPLEFTEEEQAEIAAAEELYRKAGEAVERATAEASELGDEQTTELQGVRQRYERARTAEREALRHLNEVRARTSLAARRRLDGPPKLSTTTLEERIEALGGV